MAGFPADPSLNLERFPGKTIEHLTFTNVYLGGAAAWRSDDIKQIDWALPAAMEDSHLNNVLAQYFPDGKPTTTFKPSRIVEDPVPERVYRDTIETIVASLDQSAGLRARVERVLPAAAARESCSSTASRPAATASTRSTGSAAITARSTRSTARSRRRSTTPSACTRRGRTASPSSPTRWKNTCAVFYHELCEARTDPDVEDAIRAGNSSHANDFLGWYSPQGGEIGDIPLEEAGGNLKSIMREVKLTAGSKTVPVQFMWSNAVAGPEGPIARKHATA